MGWDIGLSLALPGGLTVAPGSPGIDTSSAGALAFGLVNATSYQFEDGIALDTDVAGQLLLGGANATAIKVAPDLLLSAAPRILTTGTVPTVGSGGTGVSALSVVAGSTNTAGQVQATLTSVAVGVVIGVVAFGGGPLATAPKCVVCSLAAPTAGVTAAPVVGADTYTTSGFTLRVYGPAPTTGTYIINFVVFF